MKGFIYPKMLTYQNATGIIEYTLRSDLMFHYVLQKSQAALLNLVCSLKNISPDDVKMLSVKNPIELNSSAKETVMDIKLILNNDEILNIELQMYTDEYWISRSILYLCRAYDSIGEGDNYSLLKPTLHICITDKDLIKDSAEFYSRYLLLNTKTHRPYSTDFGINVLQLNHLENATQDDNDSGLVYWAKLFRVATWEEFKELADGHEAIEEVGNLIFELNTDNQTKELLEGRRRYKEQLATQYAAGEIAATKKLNTVIADKDATIAELQARIKELEERNRDSQE